MSSIELLTLKELASVLKTTPATISNEIYKGREGDTLPIGIQRGRRRLWLKSSVLDWLKRKEEFRKKDIAASKTHVTPNTRAEKTYRPQNPKGIRFIQRTSPKGGS